jgi:hypothetical protein
LHYRGQITERRVEYDPIFEDRRFEKLRRQWWASDRSDWSMWGPYQALAESGRFEFVLRNMPRHAFPEIHVARLLELDGYETWTSIKPFSPPRGAPAKLHTETFDRWMRASHGRLPRELLIAPQPKNPDLIAKHRVTGRLLACEVKHEDQVHPHQLVGLGVLARLFGLQVEIARLARPGTTRRPNVLRYEFEDRTPAVG